VSVVEGTNKDEINEIIAEGIAADRSDSGKHLQLLPADFSLHKKNADGITTRAVWLDWEGHKDKYLKNNKPVPSRLSDTMVGQLWKLKQSGNSTGKAWVLREFTADMVAGTLSYKTAPLPGQDCCVPASSSRGGASTGAGSTGSSSGGLDPGAERTLWLTSGCILHRIEGGCFGRVCAFRVIWPSGFDLILSAQSATDCSDWFEYLCVMYRPPREILRERERVSGHSAPLRALQQATIRSQKHKELKPHGINKLYLKISHSVSDVFEKRSDEQLFSSLDVLDPVGEVRKWGLGYLQRRYAELPEQHYASLPSVAPFYQAWETMLATFPTRHQEELRRFLVAADCDVNKASAALRKHIDWRAANLPIRPTTGSFSQELAKGKCFVHGLDHYGNPVIYYFTHRQDPRTRSIDEAIRAVLYRLEQALARLPSRDGKVTLVVVREGASAANRDLELVLPLSQILEQNYPERLHACLVFPAQTIFRTYLSLAGGTALSADTIRRVVPLADKRELAWYIPSGQLLEGLGGLDKYNFALDVARTGSAVLQPALWVLPEARDYYPPLPAAADGRVWGPGPGEGESGVVSEGVSSFGGSGSTDPYRGAAGSSAASRGRGRNGESGGDGEGDESKAEVEFVCPNCQLRQCKLCRVVAGADKHYAGWRPLDLSLFPDP